jgi:hypothetical protein
MLLLLFIIEKPIGYFISEIIAKRQVDNRISLVCNNKINQPNIILGSSRAASGLSPRIMNEILDDSTYNLGFSGSNLEFHSSILKILLANETPKRVILILDGAGTFIANNITIYRKDKLHAYLKYNTVLSELCANSSKNYWSSKISWLYRENQNFFEALNYFREGKNVADITNSIDKYGFIKLPIKEFHRDETELDISSYDIKYEDKSLLNAFNEIIDLCKKKGIQLVLVNPPLFRTRVKGFPERIKSIVPEIDFLDFSGVIPEKKYYFDSGHLNEIGAEKFSRVVSKKIVNGI